MHQVKLSGEYSERVKWVNCESYNWGPAFVGLEFYNLKGFQVFVVTEGRLRNVGFVQFWTAGKSVNCGLHDHSDLKGDDAFCEIHFALFNGSGEGGMAHLEDGKEIRLPMLAGYEHGPFWEVNEDGTPQRRADGSVVYPTHKWQAGGTAQEEQAFDVWAAIELIPSEAVHC